jgi:hypothetical protein
VFERLPRVSPLLFMKLETVDIAIASTSINASDP